MKKYLLLRNNHQSGPYSMEELKEKELLTTDLIWVENESTAWRYPNEIRELEHFARELKKPERKIYVSKPWNQSVLQYAMQEPIPALSPENQELPPLGELKERIMDYPEKKLGWRKKNDVLIDVMRVAAIFAGMVIGAFMIKKMVDDFSSTPVSQMQVVPAKILMDDAVGEPVSSNYKNALITETVQPVKDTVAAKVPAKKPKPKDIKKQLSLKGGSYNVGVLGGINGLQLKLHNASVHTVDRVTVAIQYLKPNGDVIHTDQFDIHSIKPQSTRVFDVPDSKRGVKVKYKILEVHSKDYKKAMKEV